MKECKLHGEYENFTGSDECPVCKYNIITRKNGRIDDIKQIKCSKMRV